MRIATNNKCDWGPMMWEELMQRGIDMVIMLKSVRAMPP